MRGFRQLSVVVVFCAGAAWMAASRVESAGQGAPAAVPAFRFHHVHLNTTSATKAIDFYTAHFNAQRGLYGGKLPAVVAQGKWLLFNEVKDAPAWPVVSPLYHIGWGAPDMKATYEKLRANGVPFETPLTDISQVIEAGSGRVFFAYVEGPDRAMIEINTARDDSFQHVHFLSEDTVSTGQWYIRHFAMGSGNPNPSREAKTHNGLQIYPYIGATLDGIQFFWYPTAFGRGSYPEAWKGRTGFASSRGRVSDHIAFAVDGLDAALARLEANGVRVLQRPQTTMNGLLRSAFVQAPDGVELELVEGRGQVSGSAGR
jgi:catechol 2,3-dioxygenase-like lactoylglutathione lyase family enzyme